MPLPITAIIVTYHSNDVLPQCVKSLGAAESILIMDNGGTMQPEAEAISFFHNRKNIGFGRAINRAFQKTKTPYTLIVNPDAVLHPGALERLYETAQQHPQAAIIAPVLEDKTGQTRTAWRLSHFQKRPVKTIQELAGVFCVGHIAAAAWLMNMEAVKKIGGFDKNIFLFFEDDDYTLRTRNAGYAILVEPTARAMHLQGKSSPPTIRATYIKNFHYAFSELYFTHKHRGRSAACTRAGRSILNNFFRMLGTALRLRPLAAFGFATRLFAAMVFLTRHSNWTRNCPTDPVAQPDRATVS